MEPDFCRLEPRGFRFEVRGRRMAEKGRGQGRGHSPLGSKAAELSSSMCVLNVSA